jgi:hypothetical protein
MKARPQRRRQQTTMSLKRAQRVMGESRKLLEQREMQLRRLEQFLQSADLKEKQAGEMRADENLIGFLDLNHRRATIRSCSKHS